MGNTLYNDQDKKSTIKGDKTTVPSNSYVTSSLQATSDTTKNLMRYSGPGKKIML
jgi:hypothetical protein